MKKLIGATKSTCPNCGFDQKFNFIQEELQIGESRKIIIKESCTKCDVVIWQQITQYRMPSRKVDTTQFGAVQNTRAIQ